MNKSSPVLSELPIDCMIYITCFLSRKIKQWSVLAQVSRRWQKMQKSDQAIAILKPRCLLTDLGNLLVSFPKLRFLEIESQYSMNYRDATQIALLAKQKELRSLCLKMNHLPPLKRILTSLSNLRSLSLSGCLMDPNVISSLHQLEYLRLENTDKDNITELCLLQLTNLQGLYLSLPLLTDDGIATLFSLPNENLRDITLSFCESLTSKTLQGLLIFKQLQKLKLKTNQPINLPSLVTLTQLRCLSVSYAFDPYDYHISILCQTLTGLKKLALTTNILTYNGIKALTTNILTDNGIKYITHLSSLTSLELVATFVTNQGMQVISQLTTLTKLHLISHLGLKDFAFLHTLVDLEYLDCQGCLFDDEAAKNITSCFKLTHLNLGSQSRGGISDQSVKDIISQLFRLRFLDLSFTRITGYCLPYLAQLSRLKTLDVSETQIDEQDHLILESLSHIKHLKF